jgi:hypothetical protein
MLYNRSEKNNHLTHTLIICETCGNSFDLPDEFLASLGDIICGQCDIKGSFQKAMGDINGPKKLLWE